MSVLRNNGSVVGSRLGLLGSLQEAFLDGLQAEMWEWFEYNRDRRIFTFRKWFFSFGVHVRDLRPLFVTLFGEPDVSVQPGE